MRLGGSEAAVWEGGIKTALQRKGQFGCATAQNTVSVHWTKSRAIILGILGRKCFLSLLVLKAQGVPGFSPVASNN